MRGLHLFAGLLWALLGLNVHAQQTVVLYAVADNSIYSNSVDRADGAGPHLWVGQHAGGVNQRALVRFDLSSLAPGTVVTRARLVLTMSKTISPGKVIGVHRLGASWGEGTSNNGSGGGGTQASANDSTWGFRFYGPRLAWASPGADFAASSSADLLVTSGVSRVVSIDLHAGPDSWLEFLSDPLILFPDARIETRLRLVAGAGARAIVGDAFLAHDPKGKGRPFGRVTGEIRIEREDGGTIAVDRLSVSGADFCKSLRQADRGFATHGSMLMLAPEDESARALDAIRGLLAAPQETPGEIYAGVSLLPQGAGLWTRAVARDGAALRRTMLAIWSAMRESMTGIAPAPRRK